MSKSGVVKDKGSNMPDASFGVYDMAKKVEGELDLYTQNENEALNKLYTLFNFINKSFKKYIAPSVESDVFFARDGHLLRLALVNSAGHAELVVTDNGKPRPLLTLEASEASALLRAFSSLLYHIDEALKNQVMYSLDAAKAANAIVNAVNSSHPGVLGEDE